MTTSVASVVGWIALGVIIGFVVGWWLKSQTAATDTSSEQRRRDEETLKETLRADRAELSQQHADVLARNMAISLQPLTKALGELGQHVRALEVEHAQESARLATHVAHVGQLSHQLGDATHRLASALAHPTVRGRWGEMQLQRVVELAGMSEHCDFDTQVSTTIDGATYRPDMVITLSGNRVLPVDAKVPLAAWLDAQDARDEEEQYALLKRHAGHLRQHITTLKNRDYPQLFQPAPEFTIMFVPADPFLDAALSADPDLLDFAFANNVVITTPTTLMALLRTVGLGWRQEAVSQRAKQVEELGSALYRRIAVVAEHVNKLGNQLGKTVEAFNATTASIDSRLIVTARQLDELHVKRHSQAARLDLPPVTESIRPSAASSMISDHDHARVTDDDDDVEPPVVIYSRGSDHDGEPLIVWEEPDRRSADYGLDRDNDDEADAANDRGQSPA